MLSRGWIEFEGGGSKAIKGSTTAIDVIADLVAYSGNEDTGARL